MLRLLDDEIRDCLEGAVPLTVATCAPDGTVNVTYASHAHVADAQHIALSYQFFSKTHENILRNARAAVALVSPTSGARYHLDLEYRRTEASGPLFESMKARLAGIASYTGMADVFRLRGADVYRVLNIERINPGVGRRPPSPYDRLVAVRAISGRVTQCADLSALVHDVLGALETHLGITHAMLLALGAPGPRLFTVASRGYAQSGVGSELALGCGVIGVAAEQRTPIRISHLTSEYTYSRAVRDSAERAGLGAQLETAIPLPGLPNACSQLAVPIVVRDELLGVLYVESTEDLRFTHEDEDALVAVASQVGMAMRGFRDESVDTVVSVAPVVRQPATVPVPSVLSVRHFIADDSVFIGDQYLIKGVAGAILAKLLREHRQGGRTDFTNRELRLDPALKLPGLSDNLEARLVLLQRRLADRSEHIHIERTGRGRFRLRVSCHIAFTTVPLQGPNT